MIESAVEKVESIHTGREVKEKRTNRWWHEASNHKRERWENEAV
jgi:hypothetical protein